jgi:hypothetical protein
VEAWGLGAQDAQVAGEAGRVVRVGAPAEFMVPIDEIRVREFAAKLAADS